MEEHMKELHGLFCHGPAIKESQVFIRTLEQLFTNGGELRMAKTRCWATPQRWLLTLDMLSLRTALWNPLNLKKIELPTVENDLPKSCKCLLSCDSSSAGCIVLIVDADEPVIWFCYVGGKEWSKYEYTIMVEKPRSPFMLLKRPSEEELENPSFREQAYSEYMMREGHGRKRTRTFNGGHDVAVGDCLKRFVIRSIASVEGKFYFDISSTKLGVLEFNPNPTVSTIQFDRLHVSWNCWELASPHLVESRGKLVLVVKARHSVSNVTLYRMDFSKHAWSQMDGMYDQVFFLGRLQFTASYSAWELGLKQGNVYYLGDDDLLTVFFCGEKRLPSSSYCSSSMDNLPATLLSIYNVLTKACGFIIGSQS